MGLSVLNVCILRCIRSKIRDPEKIADELNVEPSIIKENLNWLVYKKYITSDGKLTKKGFSIAPVGILDGILIKKK